MHEFPCYLNNNTSLIIGGGNHNIIKLKRYSEVRITVYYHCFSINYLENDGYTLFSLFTAKILFNSELVNHVMTMNLKHYSIMSLIFAKKI